MKSLPKSNLPSDAWNNLGSMDVDENDSECFVLLQKIYKAVHQVFTACTHVSLECLQRAVTGYYHDEIRRISSPIEVRDAASSGSVKTDHLPFRLRLDDGRTSAKFLITDAFADATTPCQILDGFVCLANVDGRETGFLVMAD